MRQVFVIALLRQQGGEFICAQMSQQLGLREAVFQAIGECLEQCIDVARVESVSQLLESFDVEGDQRGEVVIQVVAIEFVGQDAQQRLAVGQAADRVAVGFLGNLLVALDQRGGAVGEVAQVAEFVFADAAWLGVDHAKHAQGATVGVLDRDPCVETES